MPGHLFGRLQVRSVHVHYSQQLQTVEMQLHAMADARALVLQAEGQVSTRPLLMATVNTRHPNLMLWHM